jgi:hypothetical protein
VKVFASSYVYVAAKLAGARWEREAARLVSSVEALEASPWPGLHTLAQAARVESIVLHLDGSTLVTKARSRAAGLFLRSSADVWLQCDDDVYAHADVVRRLIAAARATRGLVSAPCLCRDRDVMNFRLLRGPTIDNDLGYKLRPVDRIGFGLVAIHRAGVEFLAKTAPRWGEDFPALFLEEVCEGHWLGEDFRFCDLCTRADIPVHALLEAPTVHAGRAAMVDADGSMLVREGQAS